MSLQKGYCIDGIWKDSSTDTYKEVINSSTGEVLAEVPLCTKEEVVEAIDSAQRAFESWSKLSLSKPVQYMFKWRNVISEHLDELTELCAKEHGKNLNESRGDILKALEPTELACALPLAIQGSSALQVTTGFDCETERMPLGVVAGIVPFNFPAMIPWGWMVPLAVATGNTVVLKAATPTPLTAMRMLELFYEEAKFPKGVVNLVTCTHTEADILLTDPRVKAITFVGTTRVGKEIYAKAGKAGKRVQAQTEAKNHALILKDANLEAAASAVINSAFGCAGERCMALPVVCVEEEIANSFVDLVVAKAKALKLGAAWKPETDLGPLVSQAHKERVLSWIDKGIEEGATLVLDGRDPKLPQECESGFFVGPTIFDHVTADMTIGDQEIFGPVLCIKRVKNYEEGITIMNANPFANGSSIFTQSGYYARRFKMETDGGMVGINVGIPVPSAYYPFSGNKDSFLGDQHVLGIDGYRFFTRAKTITTHWFHEESTPKKLDSWEGTVERI